MPREDRPHSFRLSPEALSEIRRIAETLGVPQTIVIEMGTRLLRALTERELVRLAGKTATKRLATEAGAAPPPAPRR